MLRTLVLTALLASAATGASAQTVRPNDGQLTCAQMSDEAATLSAGFGEDSPGIFGRVAGVAKAGAAMLVPGAGLAIAGADAVTQPGRQAEERRDQAQRDRWNYLNGLYEGRGCNDQVAAATTTAPAPPAAPHTAAVNAPTVSVEQARNESGPNH
ncbi:hypothetical protein [Brevundimonas sp. Leaf363]|uniref:hypothetical protein n=1 Tax=Brevundimonas sp. Leaf363 TaxID=1736353 RepID=UPI000AD46C79|nr:hypothetical protein [Brevundimonas sp. Leaf363]